MAVTLYTSRVVLNALGVEDYGIYNVVGGIIIMLSFVNSAMTAATQRFLTFEMGAERMDHVKTVFSTSVIIHFALALLILILGETVGLWFFNTQLNIPKARMDAAFWVYQLSIIACIINVISIPYNAAITAYERMSAFAWISLIDAGGRLLTAFLLVWMAGDKLIVYAIFVCAVLIIVRVIYGWYCKKHFAEIRFDFIWNKKYFREMFAFSGWNMIGSLSWVLATQGLNILLNIFFNPVTNAAKAIADQVQGAVSLFWSNFQQAVNPQITKSYSSGNLNYMHKLIFMSSRISFYIILLLTLPIYFEAEYILKLWLKQVPESAVIFTRLSMVVCLLSAIGQPLIIGNYATGKIKVLMLTVGIINCMCLPFAWVWLKLGGNQSSVYFAWIIVSMIAFIVRLFVVKKQLQFSFDKYFRGCLLPVGIVSCVCTTVVYIFNLFMREQSFVKFVCITACSIIIVGISVWLFGITKDERSAAIAFAENKFKNHR